MAASERMTLDPSTEVDWSLPLDDRQYHLPPEFLPLYGTAAWDAMTEDRRKEYSRHECAALCGAGIWFENMLIQAVMRHLAAMPATDPAHRYLLVEVADECRHSMMFGEYIRRAATPPYSPADAMGAGPLEQLGDQPSGRALTYMLILTVEELLDVCNRATMKDDRVIPVSRQIARLHVLEEARHVSFARTYLSELWPSLSPADQQSVSSFARVAVAAVSGLVVNPAVYETLGIEGGAEMARNNPHHQARVTRDLSKLTEFLTHIGVITDETRPQWIEMGLVAAPT